ncbi:uncharacterized protein ALTATR162_LOCUS1629 [Alternaria atra]|uniref:Uncharacterized protein n=1 Tax=Alternaria atra TaxID=119953 RepID=A0A8J2MXY9_9PLEO|nr:uncharacterized protein ALTATR162_LOCUS1629 [Alternaria atra]CAG5144950.1 unnamed protein product [Alternaria atra]
MSDQKDLSDNERNKSTVQPSDDPAGRKPQYEKGDPVKMMVEEPGNTHFKTFNVARSQFVSNRWMYELEDPVTNLPWKEGKLFPGTDLESDE